MVTELPASYRSGVLRITPRLTAWALAGVLVGGVVAASVHGGGPRPVAVSTFAPPTSASSTRSSTTTAAPTTTTTAPPVTVSTLPRRIVATPDMYPANGAVDGNGKSICPCNPKTGEPLGGSVEVKGLEVHVTDTTGHPLPGICAEVLPTSPGAPVPMLITDADGRAAVDLGPGGYSLFSARISDCQVPVRRWTPRTVALDPNGINHVEIALVRTGSVSGTVTDQDGQPFAGGCVFGFDDDGDTIRYVSLDAAGHFAVGGVTAGTRSLYLQLTCGPLQHRAVILQGDGSRSSTPVTLAPGGDVNVDFSVLRPQMSFDY
jgi:hypothetical protein